MLGFKPSTCWLTVDLPNPLPHSRPGSDLVPIVGPRPEGEVALLAVEGEVGDVHHTGALGDGRGVPGDLPVVAQHDVGVHRAREVVVGPGGGRDAITP